MKPKHLNQKDSWMLAEDIPDSDIFFFQIPFSCFTNDTSYPFIKNYNKVIASFERFHMLFYYGERNSFEVSESILKALLDQENFGEHLNKNIVDWSHKLIDFAQKVASTPIQELSNEELWKLYDKHDEIHTKLYTYGWLPVCVDMFHNNFTDYLKKYLMTLTKDEEEIEKYFVLLTTPTETSILNQEQNEFYDLYLHNEAFLKSYKPDQELPEKLSKQIQEHAEKWGHLGYIYAGNAKPFDNQHYLKELLDIAKSKVDVKKLKEKVTPEHNNIKKEQETIQKQLHIDKKHQNLFYTAQQFALTKLVRRHAQLLDLYLMHKYLLSEISKCLDVTRYQVQFMLKDEIKTALLENKINKKVLSERLNSCVYYAEKDFEQVYVGKEAEKLKKQLTIRVDENIQELKGQPACPGKAQGKVKIIIRATDMDKMNEGDVLVSIATDPDVVPAMKKASAIITEQGGVTSHAAIVSREMGTPCIIGTKIATKVFKDGDMVEVDATKGIVRKI